MDLFYATLATICFALVGLWWVVVQFKYDTLMASRGGRIAAYTASMHFIAPGAIALISTMNADQAQIWRLGTFIGSVMGIIACAAALRLAQLTRIEFIGEIILLVLFIILAVLSFVTVDLFGLKPIVVEALLNVAIVVLGVQYAWQIFAAGRPKTG